jgi:hypothetical protein
MSTGPALTQDQNILPVQAFFNLDGSFNTFIGQGVPFVISATESIGIIDTTATGTFYPVFSPVNTGSVTSLDVTSSTYTFNPGTGVLSAPIFSGSLNGNATTSAGVQGGIASNLLYQIANNQTGFIANGTSGYVLTSNGSSAPTWQAPSGSIGPITQNLTTVSTNQTIASGSNGFSVGPMTIASGVSVTVAAGQRWVII